MLYIIYIFIYIYIYFFFIYIYIFIYIISVPLHIERSIKERSYISFKERKHWIWYFQFLAGPAAIISILRNH